MNTLQRVLYTALIQTSKIVTMFFYVQFIYKFPIFHTRKAVKFSIYLYKWRCNSFTNNVLYNDKATKKPLLATQPSRSYTSTLRMTLDFTNFLLQIFQNMFK